MLLRYKLYPIFFAIGACTILIIIGIEYIHKSYFNENLQLIKFSKDEDRENNLPQQMSFNLDYSDSNIENTIKIVRSKIKLELSQYNFSHSEACRLEDLLMESGGKPIQSVIVSSWSSGTTFFGELLSIIPGTYYHFEPLQKYGMVQIRGPPESFQAVSNLENMLKCNFYEMEDYLKYAKIHKKQFRRNKRLWNNCKHKKDLCFNTEFNSRLCKLFPFQIMKLVRLRLRFIQELLENTELNVKVILLVRDPRGVFNSRRNGHRYFCQGHSDCWQPELYCDDMIHDYVAASQLLALYPDRFMVLRFEDLAFKPNITTRNILKFLRLSVISSIDKYLESHTSHESMKSTYRITRKVPLKWKYSMDFKEVDEIQTLCKDAMQLWGYKIVHNGTEMASKDFNPVENYTIIQTTD